LKINVEFPVIPEWGQKVSVTRADITSLKIDAIVNAAHSSLLGGGGVDGDIHDTAGIDLTRECAQLGGCATGQAKMTSGYKLPARHVIHTVGPRGENASELEKCYVACLQLCRKHGLRTVAFPCISTGAFGYPREAAAKVALATVRQWVDDHWEDIDRVVFCTFLEDDHKLYESLMPRYFPLELPESAQTSVQLNSGGLGPLVDTQSKLTKSTR
jgi:O-acetyl-ADP-ribose deacetylase (regulator of RNase III)